MAVEACSISYSIFLVYFSLYGVIFLCIYICLLVPVRLRFALRLERDLFMSFEKLTVKIRQPSDQALRILQVSAFWTREDRQLISKFVVACPCPDGLMQDGTQEGNEAYVISHRGARSRGYKRRERVRARARERERVSACCLSRLPRVPAFPLCPRPAST
jgi:hypothetical protein